MAALSSAPPGATITYRLEKRRCGKKTCRACHAGGSNVGHGPYWYAYWRSPSRNNKLVSSYLGKKAPAGYEGRGSKLSSVFLPACGAQVEQTEEDAFHVVAVP